MSNDKYTQPAQLDTRVVVKITTGEKVLFQIHPNNAAAQTAINAQRMIGNDACEASPIEAASEIEKLNGTHDGPFGLPEKMEGQAFPGVTLRVDMQASYIDHDGTVQIVLDRVDGQGHFCRESLAEVRRQVRPVTPKVIEAKPEPAPIIVTPVIEIPSHRVRDLIINGCEFGSRYWAEVEGYNPDATELHDMVEAFLDVETAQRHQLTSAKIATGLATLAAKYPFHYSNFMRENDDAETSDAFLQCALFGDVYYG